MPSTSGISLTEAEAAIAKGMILRGDRQHDIAAWFGVNSGRIADMSSNRKFPNVSAEASDKPFRLARISRGETRMRP